MPKEQAADTPELLTTEQVMDRLLDEAELRRVVNMCTCVLPAVKVNNTWRFRRADLEAWIERQRSAVQSRPS